MPSINYFFEDLQEDLNLTKTEFTNWIIEVIRQNSGELEEINYIYCSDNYLLQVNQTYLNHDYYTDIITFDNREDLDDPIEADIFISIDRVRDYAQQESITFLDELNRVMIHGVLHLLGQGDTTDEEKANMREREEASLSLRKF